MVASFASGRIASDAGALDSWSRMRRVIGKAEWTRGEANPRFIVRAWPPKSLGLSVTNQTPHRPHITHQRRTEER